MKELFEKKMTVNFVKRTTRNNTHLGIVDHSIKEISTWKKDSHKYNRYVLLGILSFGILFILTSIWKSLYISLVCVESDITQADYFLIIDDSEKKHVEKILKENFFARHNSMKNFTVKDYAKKHLANSPYVGKDYQNKTVESITLYYKNNKYIYVECERSLVSVKFDIESFTTEEIHKRFGFKRKGNGISSLIEYNYLLNKFGKNKIEMRQKNFCLFFLQNLFGPFFIYQLYAIILWSLNNYYPFAIITSAFSLIILIINSIYSHRNHHRILNFDNSTPATLCRDFKLISLTEIAEKKKESRITRRSTNLGVDLPPIISREMKGKNSILLDEREKEDSNQPNKTVHDAIDIVPGDIIELGNNDLIPCDCILLEGYCNVNESDLTGESSLIMKLPLPADNNYFSFETNKKSILYHGTKINKCESEVNKVSSNTVYVMALNTGYNTNRGNLVQNLLFPKNTNFKFYSDIKIFFITMSIVWFLTNSGMIYMYYNNNWELSLLLKRIFCNLTVILPPISPICMVFTSFYFHWNLSRKNISCISDRKMNAAGRVNIIVLDKTGTLTEENLEILGFQITMPNRNADSSEPSNSNLEFDDITTDAIIMNKVHKSFWKTYCENQNNPIFGNYKNNPLNNLIYFVECLVSCHSIDKLKNDLLGNSIDKKIFEKFKWILEKCYENQEMKYYMVPLNSYKITEKLIFNKQINSQQGKKYKLAIIKRFEFSSKFQSMSVIVKNELDNSYRFFIKGAPEKIIQMCNPNSIPDDFEEKQMEHTKNGFRVLGCATRNLEYSEVFNNRLDKEDEEITRKKYENNLVFLGFIIFSNKLKRDTKHVIANLRNSNCKLLMATGDNPFTSLSVARECEMIEYTKSLNTFLIDLEKDEENSDRLTLFSLNSDISIRNYENNLHKFPINNYDSNVKPIPKIKSTLRSKLSIDGNSSFSKNKRTSINAVSIIPKNTNGLEAPKNENQNSFLPKKSFFQLKSRKSLIQNSESVSQITGRSGINNLIGGKLRNSNNYANKRNYDNEFIAAINKIKNSDILCISGKSFYHIYRNYKQDKADGNFKHDSLFNIMIELVKKQGVIFYRMSPNDKIDLINFLKEDKNNIVAMCGDGANDCGALLTADVGISVRHSSGISVTSHFYSSEESIRCIELIIRNGRACLENSIVLIKYMAIYGFIQLTTCLCLFAINIDMSMSQYIYSDTLIALTASLLAIRTGTGYVLVKENPPNSILNCKFITSVIGHIILQCGSLIFYFLFFINYRVDYKKDQLDYQQGVPILVISSYLLIYTNFQYIFTLFIFNSFTKHRKEFYTNKLYILYVSGIILFTMSFISVYFEKFPIAVSFVRLEDYSKKDYQTLAEVNRLYTLLGIVIDLLLTFCYEYLVELIFKIIEKRKKNDKE